MSKAFTRESDDLPERPTPVRSASLLPPGVKNYLTPDGARRLQEELHRLVEYERPKLAAASPDNDQRRRLQSLDQRIQQLRHTLQTAEVVPLPPEPWDRIRFGATVTVKDGQGQVSCYRIVGAAEMDADRGWVSWLSPIAKALLNARIEQRVRFKFPSGEEQLEVLNITYDVDDTSAKRPVG
jgi:transcription elongation factor GreB